MIWHLFEHELQKNIRAMQPAQTQYIIRSPAEKTVIMPIREYQRLLEDLHELTVVAERHKEYPVSLDEMEAAIHKRGRRLF